ncbi:MAG: lactate utilization protein [Bacteroidia bacterium]|nr:lactate utilization protein [Bacteroidia bacterium]
MAIEQNNTTSKEKILKKVRQALIFKSKAMYSNIDLESNIYAQPPAEEAILETFARNFTIRQGQFIFCDNSFDFIDKLLTLVERKKIKSLFCAEPDIQKKLTESGINFTSNKSDALKMSVSLTGCESLIARTGSILVSSSKNGHIPTIFPNTHLVVATTSQVVMEMKEAIQVLKNKYGRNLPAMFSFITGPSSTADIEGKLVIGAHGPLELFVFLIDDTSH